MSGWMLTCISDQVQGEVSSLGLFEPAERHLRAAIGLQSEDECRRRRDCGAKRSVPHIRMWHRVLTISAR